MELFERQPEEYQKSVLPTGIPRVAIEAAQPMSWYRWVGLNGEAIGLHRFGASSPYERIYKELGITADRVVEAALRVTSLSPRPCARQRAWRYIISTSSSYIDSASDAPARMADVAQ